MDLVPVQICNTTLGWSPVHVSSSSDDGVKYLVLVSPFVPVHEFVCECKGFEYRGKCSHQRRALDQTCWWPLGAYKEEQSDEQRRHKVCPHCGNSTRWEMVDAEEAED